MFKRDYIDKGLFLGTWFKDHI
jgi:cytochrome P450